MLELLILVNLLLAALALVNLRPAGFILAVNHLVALRALENIRDFGQPESESYIPASVFSHGNVHTATFLFTLSTAWLLIFALLSAPTRRQKQPEYSPVPRWLLLIILVFFVLATFTSQTILDRAYDNSAKTMFGVNLGGVNALLNSLFIYELFRRVTLRQIKPMTGFALLVFQLFLTDYSKGSTGFATGCAFSGAILLLGLEANQARRLRLIIGSIVAMAATAFLVRSVRASIHDEGQLAISQFMTASSEAEASRSQTGQGLENQGNGTQYAAHLLECITLFDSGLSRDWRSIYNPIIYTLEPSFLLEPLGITRPLDAPWELGHYFIHGGGIYILADLYWNGGYACVILIFGLIALWSFLCDTRYRGSALWLMFLCQFAPGLLQGVGYGFAQVFRSFFNGILVVLAYVVLRRLRGRATRGDRRPDLPGDSRVVGHPGRSSPLA